VHAAHDKGILHRDLKPSNILLQEDTSRRGAKAQWIAERREGDTDNTRSSGTPSCPSALLCASAALREGSLVPKVADFGLAKNAEQDEGQTPSGVIRGTPSYMAPEQARGAKELTRATDVYALGAILYELLTARPPFKAETTHETMLAVLLEKPTPPRALRP